VAALIALPLAAGFGEAQVIGQPGRGLALAQRLCSECHAVREDQGQSPNENAPRFKVIASVPGMTSIALSIPRIVRCRISWSRRTSRPISSPIFSVSS